MDYSIIDRRKNPGGKSLPNRQRFLKRVKKFLGEEIKKNMKTALDKAIDSLIVEQNAYGLNSPERRAITYAIKELES